MRKNCTSGLTVNSIRTIYFKREQELWDFPSIWVKRKDGWPVSTQRSAIRKNRGRKRYDHSRWSLWRIHGRRKKHPTHWKTLERLRYIIYSMGTQKNHGGPPWFFVPFFKTGKVGCFIYFFYSVNKKFIEIDGWKLLVRSFRKRWVQHDKSLPCPVNQQL